MAYVRELKVGFPRTVEDMDQFEISRWFALIEAVNVISDEAEERGIKFDTLDLKPIHVKKFINATGDTLATKFEQYLKQQEEKVNQ